MARAAAAAAAAKKKEEKDPWAKDPIVKQYDVRLVASAAEVSSEVMLLQHAVRGAERDSEDYLVGRIKKKHRVMELETAAFSEESRHFDEVPRRMMLERRKLNSALVKPGTNYTVSFLHQNEFHIANLNTIYQMRPDISHIDNEENGKDTVENGNATKQKKSIPDTAATPIQNNSYALKRQLQDAEPWIELQINHTPAARKCRASFEPHGDDTASSSSDNHQEEEDNEEIADDFLVAPS